MAERFLYKTDITEMERRWKVTKETMKKEEIDCLVLYSFDRVFGGVMKYLTDLQVPLYSQMALFSQEGLHVIGHGGWGGKAYQDYVDFLNLVDNISVPSLASTLYGDNFMPEEAAKIIKGRGFKKIGLVGMSYIPAAVYKYLLENLKDAEFVNASQMMDEIKAVKSEYELDLFSKSVKLHDDLMAAVPTFLRVGRTERQVANLIRNLANDMFCPEVNVILGRHQTSPILNPYLYANDVIQPGDHFQLLIEVAAPGGVWAECGRMFSMGEPKPVMEKACADSLYLQAYLAEKSKPGARPSEIFHELNRMLEEMGYWPEKRIFAHSQSYDIVDRPCWVAEETMVLKENMFFAMHPTCANEHVSCYNCDNFVVTKDGGKKLSTTPAKIIVVDY